ncbi:MAG TPA: ABC transporter substrate-binding protein, partial [Chloroflexota bacterium]|nr:ABC transporter substrate-binding protein [Chloroflexota bacterium]
MARLASVPWRRIPLLALLLLLAAPGARAQPTVATLQAITLSMGYVPNVQFAPFYVADARGYYAAAHVKVTFDYAQSPDIIKLIAAGNLGFGNTEADQVIVGRAHGLSVVSVLTQYQRFPVVIFALQSSHIRSFADLKGKTIGIPGLYGASYTGLLAALHAAHLSTSDVKIEAINYTQVSEVARHQVDAAVGYVMNEPVQLQQLGYKVTVLPVANVADLAGAGVIASQSLIQRQPNLVQRFVQATYRGLSDTIANPNAAFTISRRYIKGLDASHWQMQLAVLQQAVRYWAAPAGHHLGCATAGQWTNTQSALIEQKQIAGLMK